MIITGRQITTPIIERIKSKNTSLAIFCTGSHWNTEAILLAARNIGEKYSVRNVPVAVGMTFNYEHMPQAQRITHLKDSRIGFLSILEHLNVLAGDPRSPYYDVQVMPHLDHADPFRDRWALTAGTEYLSSVMFDAQKYPLQKNVELTSEYVRNYRESVMIEGIMDELSVFDGPHQPEQPAGDYAQKAFDYVDKTGVDFLVADLGTEQQSRGTGKSKYQKDKARHIQEIFSDRLLVLHGTSCLSQEEISSLPFDGILRVNMWTRIAREAGLYAIDQLKQRDNQIQANDFNAIESNQYLMDSTEKAASIMESIMVSLGYANLGENV